MIKSRRMRYGGACSTHGRDEKCIYILVGKSEGKRSLGTPRRGWENNIRNHVREIGWEGVDWMHVAQVRGKLQVHVQSNEPSDSIKGDEFDSRVTISFSSGTLLYGVS
jgi:hypothetical protein